jgi:hypothetical protein
MLKRSLKLIGTIALFAVLWPSQGYCQMEYRSEYFTMVPSDMWAYWLLFLVPAGLALNPIKFSKNINHILWTTVGVLFILLIGLRYYVGTDFDNYLIYYEQSVTDLQEVFTGETGINFAVSYGNAPAYMILNSLVLKLGIWGLHGIYVVNTFCATIFVIGLIKFCKKQPLPWVALTVAVPFMVTAVAMGYTRQATALGFLMWGFSLLRPGNEYKYVAMILLGSTFHFSVIATLPFVLVTRENIPKIIYPIFVLIIAYMFYFLATLDIGAISGKRDAVENMAIVFQYTATRGSPGGPIRTYMNVLPVLFAFFIWARIKMNSTDSEFKLIKWIAIVTFMSLPLLLWSTTMVDRMGLYLMPIQLALWPRIIAVQKTQLLRSTWVSSVISFYSLVLYVFFHYANHSHYWLPYLMFPFTSEPIYPHPVHM